MGDWNSGPLLWSSVLGVVSVAELNSSHEGQGPGEAEGVPRRLDPTLADFSTVPLSQGKPTFFLLFPPPLGRAPWGSQNGANMVQTRPEMVLD